jgi:hypothetical protein
MTNWQMPRDPAWWKPDGSFSCPMGKLTKREVDQERAKGVSRPSQGHSSRVCVCHAQAVLQFSAFDVDDDGVVSYEDFATAMTRHNPALAHPSKKCGRRTCPKPPQVHRSLGLPSPGLQDPARADVQGSRHRWQRVCA